MADTMLTLAAIVQNGRLSYEALILAESYAASNSRNTDLVLLEPEPGPLWPTTPTVPEPIRDRLEELGATILPFENRVWGDRYPEGNKIEALKVLPDRPTLFVDTDTLILGTIDPETLDMSRTAASMRREDTWPRPGPVPRAQIWRALFRTFGLDINMSVDPTFSDDDWRHFLYMNAGLIRMNSPQSLYDCWSAIAQQIESDAPPELRGQVLYPWLDQISLPLALSALGGGRPPEPDDIEGPLTCHYRTLPLLYAREDERVLAALEAAASPNRTKKLLKAYDPAHRMIYRGDGAKVRQALFGRTWSDEAALRQALKAEGWWMR